MYKRERGARSENKRRRERGREEKVASWVTVIVEETTQL